MRARCSQLDELGRLAVPLVRRCDGFVDEVGLNKASMVLRYTTIVFYDIINQSGRLTMKQAPGGAGGAANLGHIIIALARG